MAKSFCFTYSKLRNFELCGRQHQAADILRLPGMELSGDAIDFANRVHKVLEDTLKNPEAELPPRFQYLQYWVDWCRGLPGEKFIEEKWALNRNRGPAEYFGAPWYRLKVDFAHVHRPSRLGHLADWKTGNRLEEPLQLWLGAACMFEQFPPEELDVIDSMFVWLKEWDGSNITEETIDQAVSREVIKRSDVTDIWDSLMPRILSYEQAVATDTFHPRPGRHCRWCRLQSCEFFSKPI